MASELEDAAGAVGRVLRRTAQVTGATDTNFALCALVTQEHSETECASHPELSLLSRLTRRFSGSRRLHLEHLAF